MAVAEINFKINLIKSFFLNLLKGIATAANWQLSTRDEKNNIKLLTG